MQLLTRRDVLPLLVKHGLLPVDAYTSAVEATAQDLEAEVMVTETLGAIEGGYQVSVTVMDLTKHKNLDECRANLDQPTLYSGPLIFREPADGPALVVPGRVQDAHNIVKALFPSCEEIGRPLFCNRDHEQNDPYDLFGSRFVRKLRLGALQIAVVRALKGGSPSPQSQPFAAGVSGRPRGRMANHSRRARRSK